MPTTDPYILVVDDEPGLRLVASRILKSAGYDICEAASGAEAIEAIKQRMPFLILMDVMMPAMDGFETLATIREAYGKETPAVIFITSITDAAQIARCFEAGADDYVAKPVRSHELLARVDAIHRLSRQQLQLEEEAAIVRALSSQLNSGTSKTLRNPDAFGSMITDSTCMMRVFHYMEAIAVTSRPVLIRGETGVGKELVAQTVHNLSQRPGEFVAANVAGFDDTLFSDTLFGHRKGAYTGATNDREGLVARAAGGTLFLDEIGDLDAAAQIKLLRLLQENEYYPLGEDTPRRSSARVIVATHCDLAAMQAAGSFRTDLYYRLMTHQIQVPPLRDRRADIPLLVRHFLKKAAKDLATPIPRVSQELMYRIASSSFPGNVRELEARVFNAVSCCTGKELPDIGFESSPMGVGASSPPPAEEQIIFPDPLPSIKQASDLLVAEALRRAAGNQTQAASMLGITRQALNKRLNK